jgi:hypothetical protein
LKRLFVKRPPSTEQIISEEKTILAESVNIEELQIKFQESKNDEEKEVLKKQIARQEVAKEILDFIENDDLAITKKINNKKQLYELHELRTELQKLMEQRLELNILDSNIKAILYSDNEELSDRVKSLYSLLSKNKINDAVKLEDFSVLNFDADFKQLEKILAEKSTLEKHYNRERIKKKEIEIVERKIKQELNNLESLINTNKIDKAKLLINILSKSINQDNKKFLTRLFKAETMLKEKELDTFKRQQAEIIRKQQEIAERIRIEKNTKLEHQRIEREIAEKKRKKEELIKEEKEEKLGALLKKKFNWRDFQSILRANGVKEFYHFTDYQNLKSIKENGGLYSWYYADSNGITINFPGGNPLSRDLDKRYGLQDYVRVSFCTNHPMQYRLEENGRSLALLEVDVEVAYYENTIFCNMNATDVKHQKGPDLKDLENVRFSATKKKYLSRQDTDFKYHQAEVLIKTWIPLNHIKNINKFTS